MALDTTTDEPNGKFITKRIKEGKTTDKKFIINTIPVNTVEVPVEVNGQTTNVTASDDTKTKGVKCEKKRVDENVAPVEESIREKTQRKTIQISALPLKTRLPRIPKIPRQNIAENHLMNPLTPNFE